MEETPLLVTFTVPPVNEPENVVAAPEKLTVVPENEPPLANVTVPLEKFAIPIEDEPVDAKFVVPPVSPKVPAPENVELSVRPPERLIVEPLGILRLPFNVPPPVRLNVPPDAVRLPPLATVTGPAILELADVANAFVNDSVMLDDVSFMLVIAELPMLPIVPVVEALITTVSADPGVCAGDQLLGLFHFQLPAPFVHVSVVGTRRSSNWVSSSECPFRRSLRFVLSPLQRLPTPSFILISVS